MTITAASPHVMNTYGRLPIAMARGEGCYLWDVNCKRYLDALGGIAVNTLGHAHPQLVKALQEQVGLLMHTSNYYHIPHQEALAAKLVALSGMTNVFFCNSGLEANEAALKMARKFGHQKGIAHPKVVYMNTPSTGAALPRSAQQATPRFKRVSGPWWMTSYGCQPMTSLHYRPRPTDVTMWSPSSLKRFKVKVASIH